MVKLEVSGGRPPPHSAQPPARDNTQVHKIVVGVDFGTTYTGISWVSTEGAHVKVLDDVHCIRDWPGPGRNGDYSWKAPTRIAYAKDNGASNNAYGFQVTPKMVTYTWFKLLLDPSQKTKFDDPSVAESQGSGVLKLPPGKTPVDLCADFLTEVAKFAYESLAKRITPEVLRATPLDLWFTVPAVWSDRAKSDTLRAARKAAGQAKLQCHPESQVFLIREPEAAAIAVLSTLTQGRSQQHIKIGDSILVCDCGGGTVDLTTYVISGISPKLTFHELVAGIGGKCGSTYIDRELYKWMEKKFGAAFRKVSWEKKGPASRFMKDFEGYKRDFGKTPFDASKSYDLPLVLKGVKDSDCYDADEHIVKISENDLQNMFDPVVAMITALLQSQLDAELSQIGKKCIGTVLLVGGFGDSAYLNKVLREWCDQREIKLYCPEHPQSAIVRGAAYSGLQDIQPSARRSRLHYGFAFHEAYDPMRHKQDDRFVWDWNGTYRASGNLEFPLAKGAIVDEHTQISIKCSRDLYEDNAYRPTTTPVYISDSDLQPYHIRNGGVKKLVEIHLDFSTTNLTKFPSKKIGGRILRRVDCEYVVHFGHRRGVLVFSCLVNGADVGNATITFDGRSEQEAAEGVGGTGSSSPGCVMQ